MKLLALLIAWFLVTAVMVCGIFASMTAELYPYTAVIVASGGWMQNQLLKAIARVIRETVDE